MLDLFGLSVVCLFCVTYLIRLFRNTLLSGYLYYVQLYNDSEFLGFLCMTLQMLVFLRLAAPFYVV